MDSRAKIALAGIVGVIVGITLLGGALAVPAIVGHVAGARGFDADEAYRFGPGSMMGERFDAPGAPWSDEACPGGRQSGPRGYEGRGPWGRQPQTDPGFTPPCGGNPSDCPQLPRGVAPSGTVG